MSNKHVRSVPPADKKDLFLSPSYGWTVERLLEAIHPDVYGHWRYAVAKKPEDVKHLLDERRL